MAGWRLTPRFRVIRGETIAFGPGKAELIEAISRTGSISEAADRLGMSYTRAWKLVRTINDAFREPVVEATRGGNKRGGAEVTRFGRRVLALYRRMEKKASDAADDEWAEMRRLLR